MTRKTPAEAELEQQILDWLGLGHQIVTSVRLEFDSTRPPTATIKTVVMTTKALPETITKHYRLAVHLDDRELEETDE